MGGGLIVFADALTDFTDEEVAVSLTRFENGSCNATDVDPLSSCPAVEEDGRAEDSELQSEVPKMDDGPADLEQFEIGLYMRMLADPEAEEDSDLEDNDWGPDSMG